MPRDPPVTIVRLPANSVLPGGFGVLYIGFTSVSDRYSVCRALGFDDDLADGAVAFE